MVAQAVRPDAGRSVDYWPRGASAELFRHHEAEVVVSGPAGTGKTYGALWRLHLAALKYPGMRGLMVRKVLDSLTSSALVTYQQRVLGAGRWGVASYGGSKLRPAGFHYPNGSELLIGGLDKPEKVMSQEYDLIYCFVGETRIESPSAIQRAYRREYSGPLITIRTAAGNELTGTPNHPILTDKGWVALGLLQEGNRVIRRCLRQEVAVRNPHVRDQPSTIAEIASALASTPAGFALTERVMGVDMDFHGDGWKGHVDVVTPGSNLQAGVNAALLDPVTEHLVGDGNLDLLLLEGLRPLDQVRLRARFALGGPGGGFGESLHPFRVAGPATDRGLAERPWWDAPASELRLERGIADADGSGDGDQPALAIDVAPDRIVHVRRLDVLPGTVRHVYNLQTTDGYYVANNIITHNCNEATELEEADWEALTTRARYGVMPYQQVYADCNPGPPGHWLYQRCHVAGKTTMLYSRHRDNPVLWDERADDWTTPGRAYLATLRNLTGHRRARLLDGTWTNAEGAVYPAFNREAHVRPVDTDGWATALGVDVGARNPTVVLTIRHAGDRFHVDREDYRPMDADEIMAAIVAEVDRSGATRAYVDPSAKLVIDALAKRGVNVRKTANDVAEGVRRVTSVLPSLTVDPSCANLIREMEAYRYPDRGTKDEPVKADDHAPDALRYAVVGLTAPIRVVKVGVE